MSRDNELVFAALGGVGEIGMNLGIYGLGRAQQDLDGGRLRRLVRLRGAPAGRRPHHARHPLPRRGTPQPPRHRAHPRARGSFRRAIDLWPRLKVPVYATPFTAALLGGQAAVGARRAGNPGHGRAARRPLHARAVRRRNGLGRAFDSGIERADHPHAARQRAAHRRLEDRPDAGARPADRRGEAAGARRRGLPRASSAIPPMPCGPAARRRKPRSPRRWPS